MWERDGHLLWVGREAQSPPAHSGDSWDLPVQEVDRPRALEYRHLKKCPLHPLIQPHLLSRAKWMKRWLFSGFTSYYRSQSFMITTCSCYYVRYTFPMVHSLFFGHTIIVCSTYVVTGSCYLDDGWISVLYEFMGGWILMQSIVHGRFTWGNGE